MKELLKSVKNTVTEMQDHKDGADIQNVPGLIHNNQLESPLCPANHDDVDIRPRKASITGGTIHDLRRYFQDLFFVMLDVSASVNPRRTL